MKNIRKITLLVIAVVMGIALTLTLGCADKTSEDVTNTVDSIVSEPLDPQSDKQIGTTETIAWYEKDCQLVYPYGRLVLPVGGEGNFVGIKDAESNAEWNSDAEITSDFKEDEAIIQHTFGSGGVIGTSVTANADGTMSLSQTAKREDGKGISSVAFSLQVPMKYDVIVPAWGGIRLTEETPDIDLKYTYLAYPREWEAQMLLIQGANGGLLVYAEDNGTQFKALNVTNDGTNFNLTIETIPQAPFDVYDEFSTVEWKMVPYKGNWPVGAGLYREFVDKTFDLPAIEASKPEWAKQIQLTVLTDIEDKEMIAELAKKVDPTKTLLELPGWRKYAYDTHYPDYTPKEGVKELIEYAHSLGYRVSVHFNMIGAALDSPEYESVLKDYHSLDAFTKKPIIEGYQAFDQDFRFSQINPASEEWRKLLVQKAVETVETLGVDGIHLDQSLICFNDGRGLVDGMTSMQGNVQLQKDLAEALPGIAFSGEGINEINMRYSSWLQQHVYGLNSGEQTWDNERFDQLLPVANVVFGDYTKLWQYPAFPSTSNEEYFQAWWRSGVHRMGIIPTLMRETTASIKNPNATMQMVLDEAKWYQDNQPKINKDPEAWKDDVLLSLSYGSGKTAAFIKDDNGEVFLPDAEKPDDEMVRFISGVSSIKLPGSILNWKLYDKELLKGLDTSQTYLYSNVPRDLSAVHVETIPENTTTRLWEDEQGFTVIEMKEIQDTSNHIVDLTKYDGAMRAGEVLDTGEKYNLDGEFNTINAFWYTMESKGQVRHLGDRIMMHPPWKDEISRIGITWMEVDVPIEKVGNAVFETGVQMASSESAKASDGVVFKFYIWDKDDPDKKDMVTYEVQTTTASPTPVSLDIAKFEGHTVTIRVECDPCKATANDSSVLVNPRVIQRKISAEKNVEYTVYSPEDVPQIMSRSNSATITSQGDGRYVINTSLSDTVYLLHSKKAASLPINLSLQPFVSNWVYDVGDVSNPTKDLMPVFHVAEVHRVLRLGLSAFPPAMGGCENTWLFTLPKGGTPELSGYVGLKEGAEASKGVIFKVKVNGETLWSEEVGPEQKFKNFSVPLSAYSGKTILLTLVSDADGSNEGDNAFWGDLFIQ